MFEDEDFNGNNGEDFTSKEAINKGFKSDKDLAYDGAEKKTKKLIGTKKVTTFIDIIVKSMQSSGGSFYEKIEYNLEKLGKNYVASFLIETAW